MEDLGLPRLLFAYGTLVPRDPSRRVAQGWLVDAIRGRLFDLGPYPGVVDLDEPSAPWVEGFTRPVEELELRDRLDPYEAVDEGLYRRLSTTTRSGRRAWIYVYARPIPASAHEITAWNGPRLGHSAPSLNRNASALEVTGEGNHVDDRR